MVRDRGQYRHHLCFTHRTQTSLGPLLSLLARRIRHTIALHASAYSADIFRRRHDVSDLAGLAFLGEGHNWHDFTTSAEHCGDTTRAAAVREDEHRGTTYKRACL
jgi:hypothetical protein